MQKRRNLLENHNCDAVIHCATGRALASAHTMDQQRNCRLSAASAAGIVVCYPKSARGADPGQAHLCWQRLVLA